MPIIGNNFVIENRQFERFNKKTGLKNPTFEDYAFDGPKLIKSANVTDVDISRSVHKNLESSTVSKIELFQIDAYKMICVVTLQVP